jgi:exodeoxyribonuclease VII large subunit
MPDREEHSEKKVFSLRELAQNLSHQIEQTYHSSYWIKAEITKLNHYPQSGHCYPQLVEKKEGRIVADLRGFFLNSRYRRAKSQFKEVTGRDLGDGMQILFRCRIGFHPVYGLSLNILEIEPAFTLGEMARLRKEAIEKLQNEGVFANNKKLYLPRLVQKLAIISVETSKGWRDFSEVLAVSPFPQSIETRLFPALLQGDAAVESIGDALQRIEQSDWDMDAVAIIRGGGGETGLDCYDSYHLARKICLLKLPVLTGIGHATNLTVVEQVAHKNLLTPTDLGKFLVGNYIDFARRIAEAKKSLRIFRRGWFSLQMQLLADIRQKTTRIAGRKLTSEERILQSLGSNLQTKVSDALYDKKINTTVKFPDALKRASKNSIDVNRQKLTRDSEELKHYTKASLVFNNKRLEFISEKARLLDPANVLKRGFSISSINGKSITTADQLKEGDEIRTQFWKGYSLSTVKQKNDE